MIRRDAILVSALMLAIAVPASAQQRTISLRIDQAAVAGKVFSVLEHDGHQFELSHTEVPVTLDKDGRSGTLTVIVRHPNPGFPNIRQRLALDAAILLAQKRRNLTIALVQPAGVACSPYELSRVRRAFDEQQALLSMPRYYDDLAEQDLLATSIRALAVANRCSAYKSDRFLKVADDARDLAQEVYAVLTRGGFAFRDPAS